MLEALGLNQYEEKVYLSLLEIGEATAVEVSKHSGVPYARIYDILDSLAEKALIAITMKKPKKYVAVETKLTFDKLIEEKIKEIKEAQEKVRKIRKRGPVIEEPVIALKGKRSFYQLMRHLRKEPKQSDWSIKTTFDVHPMFFEWFKEELKKALEGGIFGEVTEENKENIKQWLGVGAEIHMLPNKGVAIEVIDDKQTIIILPQSEVTLIINDPAFASHMRDLYRLAWKHTEKMKKKDRG